jgi:hypothetical protein
MKSYYCTIEHITEGVKNYFTFPPMKANSYTMAVAHFERMALSYSSCGFITKIEVYRELSQYSTTN